MSDALRLEPWEEALAAHGYRKHNRSGRGHYSTALYQRDVTCTGGSGLFFNFDRHDTERGVSLTAWMQVDRADGRTLNVEQFTFTPADVMIRLDAIEAEWIGIVHLALVQEDQQLEAHRG